MSHDLPGGIKKIPPRGFCFTGLYEYEISTTGFETSFCTDSRFRSPIPILAHSRPKSGGNVPKIQPKLATSGKRILPIENVYFRDCRRFTRFFRAKPPIFALVATSGVLAGVAGSRRISRDKSRFLKNV